MTIIDININIIIIIIIFIIIIIIIIIISYYYYYYHARVLKAAEQARATARVSRDPGGLAWATLLLGRSYMYVCVYIYICNMIIDIIMIILQCYVLLYILL